MSSPEDQLILRLLFAGATDRRSANYNWHNLIRTCFREDIGAVIYYALKKAGLDDQVPPPYLQLLLRQFQTNFSVNMAIRQEFSSVLAGFNEEVVPHILLKGIALAEYCYPTIALRPMTDVDILVKKSDLFTIDHRLTGCGYESVDSDVQTAIRNPDGYLASLEYHKKGGTTHPILHLHWHLVNTSVPASMFSPYVNIERFWEKSVPVHWVGTETRILAPEHLLIYLCEHALRINHSFNRLILVYDIYQVLMRYQGQLDWHFIAGESREFHLSDLVFFGLTIVTRYAGPIVPEDFLDRIRPAKLTPAQRLFWRLQGNGHRIRGSSYLLYLAMNAGAGAKIRFLLHTLYPPPPIQRQRKRAKEVDMSPEAGISRIGEIVRHLFGIIIELLKKRS